MSSRQGAAPARTLQAFVSCASLLLGTWLAWHHPLSGSAAGVIFVLAAAAGAVWPAGCMVALPALLPWLGLYPWTGWLTVEEFDLAVLAVVAGGYARAAWRGASANGRAPRRLVRTLWWLLFAASLAISLWRGVEDAGGLAWSWWQGYHEPLNSVRLAKSFVLASLLWPLWSKRLRTQPDAASRLALGLSAGLIAASLAALWERLAFPGLLDFSTDYRTTAMFWEMHVGGAGLDGCLALTFPFALHELLRARSGWRWAAAAAALLLGSYACITTFSRAVYLAIPIGVGVLLALRAAQARRAAPADGGRVASAWKPALGLMIGFGLAAAWAFPTGGYRGLLALLGTTALLLPLAGLTRGLGAAGGSAGLAIGAMLGGATWAASIFFDKGAYLGYAALWFATAALLIAGLRSARGNSRSLPILALAGFAGTVCSAALVAWHWGGGAGLERALPGAVLLGGLGLFAATRERSPWPAAWRWQGSMLGALAALGILVATFTGGAYMSGRFATGEEDSLGRWQHWRQGLAQLDGPADWAFGKGLGRFAATVFMSGNPEDETGDYRLEVTEHGPGVVLTGGRFVLGWGEMLRLSQRIEVPVSPARVRFEARVEQPVKLHLEVCEKHLLYNGNCSTQALMLTPGAQAWQRIDTRLSDDRLSRGPLPSLAPRLIVFSVAVESSGGRVHLADLHLAGADGRELLANGNFADGLSRWFFSSDRYHMPWHIKNLEAHVLFEQGLVGLALFAALVAGALWRAAFGAAQDHEVAPPLAASLIGALVIGASDSLFDMPRIAFLFYLLAMLALSISRRPGSAAKV
ncbi:hypothetical protein BH11PSE9_BH11PSE9_01510 [soil metagenome]